LKLCHHRAGKSVNELVVAEWSKVKNWAYVGTVTAYSLAGLLLARHKACTCLLQFASVEIPIERPVKTLEVHTVATATKYVKIS
jgi:hypothetical protein